jgi:murein DD-endopeptidase MepM/ murein hydrolase activator NlpD
MSSFVQTTAKTAAKVMLLKNPITWIVAAILFLFGGLFFIVALLLMSMTNSETGPESIDIGDISLISPSVLRYESLVKAEAAKNGIEQHTNIILALIQQESGGAHLDVMQSSESLGLPPNSITDPAYSIEVGVKYFAGVLKESKGDIKLALQSYNFGGAFIPYALERGGYSKGVAAAFSQQQAKKLGWSRYGDVNYVDNVMRYIGSSSQPVNGEGFIQPIESIRLTSNFGSRIDPITGGMDVHAGVDFGCQRGDPIFATKDGKVSQAGWQNPNNHSAGYGQRVYIEHSSTLTSIYAHLSSIHVKVGEKVKAGQRIGSCGTTGSSTGNHLHFEIVLNGNKVNPLPYIQ